jgi:glycosyltransferase involved in cell wall biosynthesis
MKPSVCHLTSVHPVFDTRIFYKECVSLAKAGWNVMLIAKTEKEQIVEGVKLLPFYKYKNRLMRILFSPIKMFFMAKEQKADIYHFHDPELLVTGLILRLFTRSKVIYDIHENYTKTISDSRWIKFKIGRLIISKIFKCFEAVACRLMSANIVVLPEWLSRYPRAILVRNYPILEKIDERSREDIFVYVGVIGKERSGLEMTLIFLELLKLMPGIHFKIVGLFWEKETEKEIMGIIDNHQNISFLGYRPFPEVRKILAKSKYGFVLYSSNKYLDNIPVKMFEYLANGVIPIYSSFKGFKYEMEKEGWGIGINPKHPPKAAQKLYDIISDSAKMKALYKSLKTYRKKYNWESEEQRLLDIYGKLIEN